MNIKLDKPSERIVKRLCEFGNLDIDMCYYAGSSIYLEFKNFPFVINLIRKYKNENVYKYKLASCESRLQIKWYQNLNRLESGYQAKVRKFIEELQETYDDARTEKVPIISFDPGVKRNLTFIIYDRKNNCIDGVIIKNSVAYVKYFMNEIVMPTTRSFEKYMHDMAVDDSLYHSFLSYLYNKSIELVKKYKYVILSTFEYFFDTVNSTLNDNERVYAAVPGIVYYNTANFSKLIKTIRLGKEYGSFYDVVHGYYSSIIQEMMKRVLLRLSTLTNSKMKILTISEYNSSNKLFDKYEIMYKKGRCQINIGNKIISWGIGRDLFSAANLIYKIAPEISSRFITNVNGYSVFTLFDKIVTINVTKTEINNKELEDKFEAIEEAMRKRIEKFIKQASKM